jgi:hypothetical protein
MVGTDAAEATNFCSFVLTEADRTCRSGLELVCAIIALTHMGAWEAHGTREGYRPIHKTQIYVRAVTKQVPTCDYSSPNIIYTSQHGPAIRQAIMSEASSDRKELKANWKTEVEVPLLTLDDVAKHNTKNDLWMVIHGGGEQTRIELDAMIVLTGDASIQRLGICSRSSRWTRCPY